MTVSTVSTSPTFERYEFWLEQLNIVKNAVDEALPVIEKVVEKAVKNLVEVSATADIDFEKHVSELSTKLKPILDKSREVLELVDRVRSESQEVAKLLVMNMLMSGEYRGRKLSQEEISRLVSERSRELYYAVTGKWSEPYFEELYTRLTDIRKALFVMSDLIVTSDMPEDAKSRTISTITDLFRGISTVCVALMKASLWLVDRHVHTLYPVRKIKDVALRIHMFTDVASRYLDQHTHDDISYADHIVDEAYRLLLDLSTCMRIMQDVIENLPLRDDEKDSLRASLGDLYAKVRNMRHRVVKVPVVYRKYAVVMNVFRLVEAEIHPAEQLLDITKTNLEKALQDLAEEKRKVTEHKSR